jgi:glycosyltransferase involved in cell wall biosynthesis
VAHPLAVPDFVRCGARWGEEISVQVLRVLPEARSAHFERSRPAPDRVTIYVSRYRDLDPSSMWPGTRQVSTASAWLWAFRRRWDVVQLPEPLWLRALPLTFSVGLAVRLSDLVFRRKTWIGTYAMENNDSSALLRGIPGGAHGVLFGIVRLLCGLIFDRVALASAAANECYVDLRLLPRKATTAQFQDLPQQCLAESAEKVRRVTFMGVLEPRKGVPDLLAAWTKSGLGADGWTLALAGAGPLADDVARAAAADASVTALGMIDRSEMHELMASSSVVVLPSRRDGRWREQIGLPIVEGLAHGCHVVATPDTGLREWLRSHGHHVLPEQFTVADLATALCVATRNPLDPGAVRAALPALDCRIRAENWMREAATA